MFGFRNKSRRILSPAVSLRQSAVMRASHEFARQLRDLRRKRDLIEAAIRALEQLQSQPDAVPAVAAARSLTQLRDSGWVVFSRIQD